jgi:hypothetical protein
MTANAELIWNDLAYGRIKGGITSIATSIELYPGDIQLFLPQWSSGKNFYLTITDSQNNIEVVKVTDLTAKTNKLTVSRGQDGTNAREWYDGAIINQRMNAALLDVMIQKEAPRPVAYNPNGILTAAYRGEKVYQTGNIWWKNISGTDWQLIAGELLSTLVYYDNDDQANSQTNSRPYYDGTFLYVPFYHTGGGQGGIYVYSINESNELVLEKTFNPHASCISACGIYGDGTYLFFGYQYAITFFICSATVDGSGNITIVDSVLVTDGNVRDIWHDGTYLYVVTTGSTMSFSVDGDGNLTEEDSKLFDGYQSSSHIYHDDRFVYSACNNEGLRVYSVDGSIDLTLEDSDDRGAAYDVSGDGTYIYVANAATGVEVYTVDENGDLTHVSTFSGLGGSVQALMCANGFVITEDSTDTITVLSVNAGVLSIDHEIDPSNMGTMQGIFGYGIYLFQNAGSAGTNLFVWEA